LKAPEGLRCGLLASAIETALSGTGTADDQEARRKRLASAVQADRRGSGRDPFLRSENLHRHPVHFDVFQSAGVVGLDSIQFAGRARARVRGANGFDRTIKRCFFNENLCSGCGAAIMVDDGVAQKPIEPGIGAAFVAQLREVFDGAQVSCLKEVFSRRGGIDSLAQESEKRRPLVA
jgi:hypothetical protein